jgi:hypothetical protein
MPLPYLPRLSAGIYFIPDYVAKFFAGDSQALPASQAAAT